MWSKRPAFLSFLLAILLALPPLAALGAQNVKPADLGFALSFERFSDLKIAPSPEAGFVPGWFLTLDSAFRQTSVGDAFSSESPAEDWRLVSVRVVPCQPFGTLPQKSPNLHCWPEVRLVWQPVLPSPIVTSPVSKWYADDRAIHVLFEPKLSGQNEADGSKILQKAKSAAVGQGPDLSLIEANALRELQKAVAAELLTDVLKLRDEKMSEADFNIIGERPEYSNRNSASQFVRKLRTFLAKHAALDRAKALTSFSLPEGRNPPALDEWVFLSYRVGSTHNLIREPMDLFSAHNGQKIVTLPEAALGSQMREDPFLYGWLEKLTDSNPTKQEVEKNVMVWRNQGTEQANLIADRSKILVPNTTCASCHRINKPRFNFHNFSYLEDRGLNVGPRVLKDVNLDLAWIQETQPLQ
jgi:hypothetical protein